MGESNTNPWERLGLDPTTSDERAVKRAYASLLKKHRPDVDPEGFKILHDAYQTALAILAGALAIDSSATSTTTFSNSSVTDPPVGPQFQPSKFVEWESFCAELGNPNQAEPTELFHKLFADLPKNDPEFLAAWESSIMRMLGSKAHILGNFLLPAQIMELLVKGKVEVAGHAVEYWNENNHTDRLESLARDCLKYTSEVETVQTAVFQLKVAEAIAFIDLELAQTLTDKLFSKIPPEVRDALLPRIEERFMVANIFERIPVASRSFWEKKLFRWGNRPLIFEDLAAEFEILALRCHESWLGFAYLSSMMGSELFSKLVKQFPPLKHAQNMKRRSERKFFYIFLIFAALCIVWLVYFLKQKTG